MRHRNRLATDTAASTALPSDNRILIVMAVEDSGPAARPQQRFVRRACPSHGLTTTSPLGPRNSTSSEFRTSRPRIRSFPMKSA